MWTGHITEASKPVEVSVVLPTGDEGVVTRRKKDDRTARSAPMSVGTMTW